jgi:thiol-disulfide isomerase/thioredoxin
MKKFAIPLFCVLLFPGVKAVAQSYDGTSDDDAYTRVGDKAPSILVHEMSGDTFSLADKKGKVVVVDFWATWCVPCQLEMLRLDKEIWGKYKSSPDFAMVAIGANETKDTVSGYLKQHAFTFPLAYDPDKSAFLQFAGVGIPRAYVVDRHGCITYQSVGYGPTEIADLDEAIQKALAAK